MSTSDPSGEPITEAGLAALKIELGDLETVARREIAARILTARGHGDLKENGGYHAAKEDQALLETRILRLRQRLRGATVVEATSGGDVFSFAAQPRSATKALVRLTPGSSSEPRKPTAPPASSPPNHRSLVPSWTARWATPLR